MAGAREDPVDLSISVTGGEETNEDSRSSGERKGRSPGWKLRLGAAVWTERAKQAREGGAPWRRGRRRVGLDGKAGRRVARAIEG